MSVENTILLQPVGSAGVDEVLEWQLLAYTQGTISMSKLTISKHGDVFALLDRLMLSHENWRQVFAIRLVDDESNGFQLYDASGQKISENEPCMVDGFHTAKAFLEDFSEDGTWYYKSPPKPRPPSKRLKPEPYKKPKAGVDSNPAPAEAPTEAPAEALAHTSPVKKSKSTKGTADAPPIDVDVDVDVDVDPDVEANSETTAKVTSLSVAPAPADDDESAAPAHSSSHAPALAHADMQLPDWIMQGVRFMYTQEENDGAVNGGMVVRVSDEDSTVVVALDSILYGYSAKWVVLPFETAKSSLSPAIDDQGWVEGVGSPRRKVAALNTDNYGSVIGVLIGQSNELVFNGGANAYLAHYPAPHLAATRDGPKTRDTELRRSGRAFALGDIVAAINSPSTAVVARVVHKCSPCKRYLILYEYDTRARAWSGRFFPGSWFNWYRVPSNSSLTRDDATLQGPESSHSRLSVPDINKLNEVCNHSFPGIVCTNINIEHTLDVGVHEKGTPRRWSSHF